MAGAGQKELSTPYFDNLLIGPVNGSAPEPTKSAPQQTPIYGSSQSR